MGHTEKTLEKGWGSRGMGRRQRGKITRSSTKRHLDYAMLKHATVEPQFNNKPLHVFLKVLGIMDDIPHLSNSKMLIFLEKNTDMTKPCTL